MLKKIQEMVDLVVQVCNKPVTISIFVKLMICINLVALAMCYKIASVQTTKDQETLEYINYLEDRVDYQSNIINAYILNNI